MSEKSALSHEASHLRLEGCNFGNKSRELLDAGLGVHDCDVLGAKRDGLGELSSPPCQLGRVGVGIAGGAVRSKQGKSALGFELLGPMLWREQPMR
jgi:hypothetical protein